MRLFSTFAVLLVCLPGGLASDPAQWAREWPVTDFSITTVEEWSEIRSGGPPRDGIPALNNPRFGSIAEAGDIGPREPVVALELGGAAARAYPLRYLMWHEIVNDTVNGVPVAVTYCPLCNSAMVFDRRTIRGKLRFGVTGKLRNSDMVMFDRETESWWQQAVGVAIAGEMTGTELKQLPVWLESWQQFTDRNPEGLVMLEPSYSRPYGSNPYRSYDSAARPFLYNGENPPHGIAPLARVVRVGDRAWPLERLAQEQELAEAGVTLSWQPGQASALDSASIADGRDVGSVRVRDLQGRDLPHDVMFAFAFHAFWPGGEWMTGQ